MAEGLLLLLCTLCWISYSGGWLLGGNPGASNGPYSRWHRCRPQAADEIGHRSYRLLSPHTLGIILKHPAAHGSGGIRLSPLLAVREPDGIDVTASTILYRAELPDLEVSGARAWLQAWSTGRLPSSGGSGTKGKAAVCPGVPKTSIPIRLRFTESGLVVESEATKQALLDIQAVSSFDRTTCSLVVYRPISSGPHPDMGPQLRSLLMDTETSILSKLRHDLRHTQLGGGKGQTRRLTVVEGRQEVGWKDLSSKSTSPSTPQDAQARVDRARQEVHEASTVPLEREEEEDKEEEEPDLRDMTSADLEELTRDTTPEFAEKATQAYENFANREKIEREGVTQVMLDELEKFKEAVPEDVQKMFESAVDSSMELSTKVKEKAEKARQEAIEAAERQRSQDSSGMMTLEMMFEGTGLKGGLDIFQGPPGWEEKQKARAARGEAVEEEPEGLTVSELVAQYGDDAFYTEEELGMEELKTFQSPDPNSTQRLEMQLRFDLLFRELVRASGDIFTMIAAEYHDVILDDHFIPIMKDQLKKITNERERAVMLKLTKYAEKLVVQLSEAAQLFEMEQLKKIQSICNVAREDMSKLSDYVCAMREQQLLDDDFVSYLNYLIRHEKGEIEKSGMDADREPTTWLMVLQVLRKGIYHELARPIKTQISMIHFISRFEEEDEIDYLARAHVNRLVPSHVIPFKSLVLRILQHFDERQEELTDHELDLAGKVLQIAEVVEEIYPDDKVLALLQTKEGLIGRENILAREAALAFDAREWDDNDIDQYWDIPMMAAKYESILQKYGFTLQNDDPAIERIEPPEDQEPAGFIGPSETPPLDLVPHE